MNLNGSDIYVFHCCLHLDSCVVCVRERIVYRVDPGVPFFRKWKKNTKGAAAADFGRLHLRRKERLFFLGPNASRAAWSLVGCSIEYGGGSNCGTKKPPTKRHCKKKMWLACMATIKKCVYKTFHFRVVQGLKFYGKGQGLFKVKYTFLNSFLSNKKTPQQLIKLCNFNSATQWSNLRKKWSQFINHKTKSWMPNRKPQSGWKGLGFSLMQGHVVH